VNDGASDQLKLSSWMCMYQVIQSVYANIHLIPLLAFPMPTRVSLVPGVCFSLTTGIQKHKRHWPCYHSGLAQHEEFSFFPPLEKKAKDDPVCGTSSIFVIEIAY